MNTENMTAKRHTKIGLVQQVDRQEPDDAEEKSRPGVQHDVPPPVAVVVILRRSQIQRQKQQQRGNKLEFRRDNDAMPLEEHRQHREGDHKECQEDILPIAAPHEQSEADDQHGLNEQRQAHGNTSMVFCFRRASHALPPRLIVYFDLPRRMLTSQ